MRQKVKIKNQRPQRKAKKKLSDIQQNDSKNRFNSLIRWNENQ